MARYVIRRQPPVLAAVEMYRDKGWHPVPLPRGEKKPPPEGCTGAGHLVPDDQDYERWERNGAWGNVALVMPRNVIGYDVDAYKGGKLPPGIPPALRSTSRDDGSGIYLYTVPSGTRLRTQDGPGIDIIQNHHRYAVVWPSLHPEGGVYEWLWPHNAVAPIPDLKWLPALPDSHLRRLKVAKKKAGTQASGGGFKGDWIVWVDQLPGGRMGPDVRRALRRGLRELQDGSCRYDAMVRTSSALVGLGAHHHRGVPEAIDDLIDSYLAAVDGEHDDPRGELERAIGGAVEKYGGRRRRC